MPQDPRYKEIQLLLNQIKNAIGMTEYPDEGVRRVTWRAFQKLASGDTLAWYQEAKYNPTWSSVRVVESLVNQLHKDILSGYDLGTDKNKAPAVADLLEQAASTVLAEAQKDKL